MRHTTLAILCLILLAGCDTFKRVPDIRAKSATELAVSEIKQEWLIVCAGPESSMPENQVGNLLQDYADLAAAFAVCMERHKSLSEYLVPVVKKERAPGPSKPSAVK